MGALRFPLALLWQVSFVLPLIALGVYVVSHHENYYMEKYALHHIDTKTGKSMEELRGITKDLIAYLDDGDDAHLSPYFQNHEILHMHDVYGLMKIAKVVRFLVLPGLIVLGLLYRSLGGSRRLLALVGAGLLLFLVAFGGLIAMTFSKSFVLFHEMFFDNDLWLMDPSKDLMIQMLPEDVFSGMALRIGAMVAGGMLLVNLLLAYRGGVNHADHRH